jgi:hypothetical protein
MLDPHVSLIGAVQSGDDFTAGHAVRLEVHLKRACHRSHRPHPGGSMHPVRSALVLSCILALPACVGGADAELEAQAAPEEMAMPGPAAGEPDLEAVRTATERYRDVNVALAEGFIPDPTGMCVTAEMEGRPAAEGAMGIHYFRPDLLGLTGPPDPRVDGVGTHTDFNQPAVLIYEPQADGSLELVAVENLVFQKAWAEAGNTNPPSFHTVAYASMIDDPSTEADEAHGFEPHFEHHVWLYRANPNGVFAPFNPAVTCEHAQHGQSH